MTASLTVIVLARRDRFDVEDWHTRLERAIRDTGRSAEIVYAISDRCHETRSALEMRQSNGSIAGLVTLTHWYDEAAAVQAALRRTAGTHIIVVAAGFTIDGKRFQDLLQALDRADVAVLGDRRPQPLVGGLAKRLFGVPLGTSDRHLRAFRRPALVQVADRSVSFPLMTMYAVWQGLEVAQVDCSGPSVAPPGPFEAFRDGFSLLFLYALLDFAKRPLRLFGLLGGLALLLGLLVTLPLVVDRLLLGQSLADEPTLLPGLLLTALGLQCGVIGLVAELLVYMRSRSLGDDGLLGQVAD